MQDVRKHRSNSARRGPSAGFSLIEVTVALAVTVVISGAVYGLMAAGQGSFRREPQLTDRQQAIRQAMAIIQEDVLRAGVGMPPWVQAFTDGLNGTGPLAGALVPGQQTDVLEILAGEPNCPPQDVCNGTNVGGGPVLVSSLATPPTCAERALTGGGFLGFVRGDRQMVIHPAVATGSLLRGCGGAPHFNIIAPPIPQTPAMPLAGGSVGGAGIPMAYVPVQVVNYQVADCGTGDGMPCLYRSTTGTMTVTGAPAVGPPGPTWQIVARGIDDLQVQYRSGNTAPVGAWDNNPGLVNPGGACAGAWPPVNPCTVPAAFNSVVQQVQVTLSSRVLRANLQGESSTGGAVPQRVRGQMTAVFTPRVALAILSNSEPAATPGVSVWR